MGLVVDLIGSEGFLPLLDVLVVHAVEGVRVVDIRVLAASYRLSATNISVPLARKLSKPLFLILSLRSLLKEHKS